MKYFSMSFRPQHILLACCLWTFSSNAQTGEQWVNLGPDTTICRGICITLSATVPLTATYEWSTGDTIPAITICPDTTDTIWVKVIFHDPPAGSVDTVSRDTIVINATGNAPLPNPDMFAEAEFCKDSCIRLYAPLGGLSYAWTPAAGLDSPHTISPLACPQFIKNIYVVTTLTDTGSGCAYKDTVTLWMIDCDTLTDSSLTYTLFGPSSFPGFSIYPNPAKEKIYLSFNKNSTYFPDIYMRITNTMGVLIYESMEDMDAVQAVDVSMYQRGLYYIILKLGNDYISKSFVIY